SHPLLDPGGYLPGPGLPARRPPRVPARRPPHVSHVCPVTRAGRRRAVARVSDDVGAWVVVIPVEAWAGGIAAAILIGAFAGLMPAVRASRMPPTVALRTV